MERGGGGWPGRIIKAAWKQYKTIKGSYHNRAVQPGTILYLAGKRGGDGGTAAAHASRRIAMGERWREGGGGGQLSNICDNNLEPGIEALVAASCKSRICIYGLFDPFLRLSRSTLTSSVRILLFPCGYRSIFLRVDKLKKKRKEKKVRLSEKIEIG